MQIKKIVELIQEDKERQEKYDVLVKNLNLTVDENKYENLIPCILMTPILSIAMADDKLSFFEKVYIEGKIKANYPANEKYILSIVHKLVKDYKKYELLLLDIYKEIFVNKKYKKYLVDEMLEIAGVDGGLSTAGNIGLMMLTGIFGLGIGAKIYFEKMDSLSLAGSVSKKEIIKINEICNTLGIEGIKEDSHALEEHHESGFIDKIMKM